MPARKRAAAEAQLDLPIEPHVAPELQETLNALRNMWEFASLMQYIFLFGAVVKIDEDFDMDDLEAECLRPEPSEKLLHIGLALLKYVSSHRGLTPQIFDEYTRRQYVAKAPARNPFGDEEEPAKFNELDIFTRIRVLQQLSTWTFTHIDRVRSLMPKEEDDLTWRMEPIGWDKDDRTYFVLDDNRLYRRTDVPVAPLTPPPPKPKTKAKAKSKKAMKPRTRGTRSSKRRKVESEPEEEEEEVDEEMPDVEAGAEDDTVVTNGQAPGQDDSEEPGYGFTSRTWECVAITLEEYQEFLSSIFRSRDPNEKALRARIETDVLPILEQRAEKLRQKELKKLRELENMQKMATAKRSSRLAGKAEKEKAEQELREAEEKKARELQMAHEEQDRQRRIEEGHESRRLTREQRLKEREVKRILHEEELARLESEGERAESQDPSPETEESKRKRLSERQNKAQREQHRKELEALEEQEKDWYFDCSVCGLNGENLDDGSHSIACESCSVWQHSKCHGFTPKQSEKDDFHFICEACKRKQEDAKKPKIPTLKLGKNRASGSPEAQKGSRPNTANGVSVTPSVNAGASSTLPAHVQRQLDGVYIPPPPPGIHSNGYDASQAYGHSQPPAYSLPRPPSGHQYPSNSTLQARPPQQAWQSSHLPPPGRPSSSGYASSMPTANGYAHPSYPNHQHQHQYAHQSAVHSSGGHPGYQAQPSHQQAQYAYTPQANGAYPTSSPPPPQYNPPLGHQPVFPPHQTHQHQSFPSRQPQQPPHRPGSAHLMNGFQSPVKRAIPSSPAAPPAQPNSKSNSNPQPQQSPIIPSPKTSFPPPSNGYGQNAGHSPTKSSPAAPPRPLQRQTSQSFEQQPVYATPSNGRPYQGSPMQAPPHQFRTPTNNSTAAPPAPPSATANGVAADGMSGPWPESSKVIPQKHDQSPAPPPLPSGLTSSQETIASTPGSVSGGGSFGNGIGGITGTPKLAPSPAPKIEGPGSVPVKRDVDIPVEQAPATDREAS